jgi:phage baseplate assembly protein W
MAIEVGNIPAFDQTPSVGLGLALPFKSIAASGSDSIFKINYTSAEQVKFNMINWFLTNKGERVFDPNFGGGIPSYLFEQGGPQVLETIKKSIEDDIALVFPMVELKEVMVTESLDGHTIQAQIFYSVFSSVDQFIELNIPL